MSFIADFFRPRPPRPPRPPLPDPVLPTPPITGAYRTIPIHPGPFYKRQMSYWANAWRDGQTVYVFAGDPARGGPAFFVVDVNAGTARPWEGAQVPYGGETEGWEWLPDGRIQLFEGPRLHRVNPFTGQDDLIFEAQGHMIEQPHSSPSMRTISATVKDANYQKIGTVVWQQGPSVRFFPVEGTLDESSLCGDEWLIIKEGAGGEDNHLINLLTGESWWIKDRDRAIGHSDCWPPYVVGEADKPDPGGCGVWDLRHQTFRFLFPSLNMGYISAKGGRYLQSGDTHLSLLNIETGELTPLLDHGVRSGDYDDRVKANLDWTGTVAVYMTYGSLNLLVL